jgi:hypothetical protein
MSTPQQIAYEVPVPDDLRSIRSINNGTHWIHGVIPDSVKVESGVITFTARWQGGRRQISIATDLVGGYECEA